MDRFADLSLWIDVAAILVVGSIVLYLLLQSIRFLSKRVFSTPLTFRPLRVVVKWAGIFIIVGLLINRIFAIDLMSIIVGGLALVAIGVVAVWSILSHTTATFLLIMLRPFRIHDWITFPGEDVGGKVIDLNLFYTLLDNEEGEHFIIPNNQFFQKTIKHIPGKRTEKIELFEQLDRSEPASEERGENVD